MMHDCLIALRTQDAPSAYAYISPHDWRHTPRSWYPGADGPGHYEIVDDWTRRCEHDGSLPSIKYVRLDRCPVCDQLLNEVQR